MDANASSKRSIPKFFLLVFALAIPFWIIGALFDQRLPLPMNLPVSSFAWICPLMAALILVYREDGFEGIKQLFKRILDYKRIKPKIWYVPILLLSPVIYSLSYAAMRIMGLPLPAEMHIPVLTAPLLFAMFFVGAVGEEGGWTGYAIDPMQGRWSALSASIILGLVWATWHVVPFIQTGNNLEWVAWKCFQTAVFRVLIVWIYNNAGRSVLAAVLVHDMDNVSWSLFPNNGSYFDPGVVGPIMALTVVIVTFLWGWKTLAQFRYPCKTAYGGNAR